MGKMKDVLVQIPDKQKDSFWSWVVCVSSFCVQFVAFGFHNSFGTFFVALLDKYGKSESATAWVGAVAIGLTFVLGPFATYLCRHIGCRLTACTGSLLVLISAFSTSLVTEMKWMYLTFSLLNGLGSTMLYFSSLVVLIEYFHKHLSVANGIVLSGSGIGTLCITLMSQNLISNYGLGVTYRVLGGLFVICFFAGLTFSPIRNYNEDFTPEKKQVDTEEMVPLTSRWRTYFKIGEQWKNKGFIVWTIATAVVLFAYYIPSMYIVSIAKGVGVPPSRGGLLVGFLAIAHTIGKIVIGKIADLPGVNRLTVLQLGLLVSAVINCLLPLAKTFEMLVAYSVVQGFCDGSFGVLVGLVTHDVVGKRLMADAIGCLYLVVALPMTLGPPVAGMFYDHMGNYHAVFFLSSALVCTGICMMFAVPWLVPASLPEKDLLVMDDYNEVFHDHDSEGHYDMSYVDEQKLADLFGRKKARNLLLERASLRNSIASTRASSFVLFSIVSEDQQRDISAYTSRQELSLLSGANTPIRGTPSTRRRHFDLDSRTSMYSLRQSLVSVAHSELHAQDSVEQEHVVIPFESALETVEEAAEFERKIPCEETRLQQPDSAKPPSIEVIIEETEGPEVKDDVFIAEEPFTVENDEESRKRTSWNSKSNNSLKSSGTQLSEGTVDSGFGDSWMGSSDVDSRYSVENFIDSEKTLTDVIPRSYSWNSVSTTTQNHLLTTYTSQEYIDYVRESFSAKKCANSTSELDWDYSDSKAEYIEELVPNIPSLQWSPSEEFIEDVYALEIEKVHELNNEYDSEAEFKDVVNHKEKSLDLEYTVDAYSLEVERALELAEEVEEALKCDYDCSYFNLKEDFRETVV